MTLSRILTRTAERHSLIKRHIVSYNGRFADNNAGSVINKKALSDLRSGMYFNICFFDAALRNPARCKEHSVFKKPVRFAVHSDRLKARIKEHYLNGVPCCRVAVFNALNIFF